MTENHSEYIVTLKDKKDLQEFYHDMEHVCEHNSNIPTREVEVADRRLISRNTHYFLTDCEAQELRKDPRVRSVELTPKELGLVIRPLSIQTSDNWDKSPDNDSSFLNWGLLRSYEGQQRPNWGRDGIASQSGSIEINANGRNVDVVIVDGHINPLHPEYAVNPDGTGGSRVIQYNWFQHNPEVLGTSAGVYTYTPYIGTSAQDDNDHGAHVAGTACGNTQGWARGSNIYNINPYTTNPNGDLDLYLFDYIREFHRTKAVNISTGRKNPTITNNSWGYGFSVLASNIDEIVYQGQTINGPFTSNQLINNYGIILTNVSGTNVAFLPFRFTAIEADIEDAINEGIIVVGAASNDYVKIDVVGGDDYNNTVNGTFYHRGSTPGASSNVICVGAISASIDETKSFFSNCGPRIDVYAPGQYIISSLNSSVDAVTDSRNSSYYIGKYSGTSMASPQVCGVLACALEIYPNMSHQEARDYLSFHSKENQILDTAGSYSDYTSLQGSVNKYLYFKQERLSSGNVSPKVDYFLRPPTGKVYPRVRLRRKG